MEKPGIEKPPGCEGQYQREHRGPNPPRHHGRDERNVHRLVKQPEAYHRADYGMTRGDWHSQDIGETDQYHC